MAHPAVMAARNVMIEMTVTKARPAVVSEGTRSIRLRTEMLADGLPTFCSRLVRRELIVAAQS